MKRSDISLPDFRNVERGHAWLRKIIEASERMDAGDNSAMEKVCNSMADAHGDKREREPGDDDE